MDILHLIRSLDSRLGGPVEVVRQTAEAHRHLGHNSEVACLDAPSDPWIAGHPLTVHALGPGRGTYGSSPAFAPWLSVHHARFDMVVVHGLWQYHGLAAWRALAGSATPYVVFPHGMLDPWFKRAYPLKHVKKWLYWTWVERHLLRDAAAVLFTTEEERILARTTFWRYHVQECVVGAGIAAPVAEEGGRQRAVFLARFPHLSATRNLLFLGRIHPKKGCDLLLHAFAAVAGTAPELRLVMAGPDQDGWVDELRRLAASLGIAERITWAGMLNDEIKWGALRSAEAFVLPSHQENFGIAVAEALACGVPVLISRRVNIWREVIADGAGLAEDDTIAGTTAALRRWCALDAAGRVAMGGAASRCFARRFAIDHTAAGLAKLFACLRGRTGTLVGSGA